MKTLFKSQELWDLVENGCANPNLKENRKKDSKACVDPDEETRLKENRKKDSKAL